MTRRTTAKRRSTRKPAKFVVTARYTMQSRPMTTTQKNALISRVRRSGGKATARRV